jgi:hypothetical protein
MQQGAMFMALWKQRQSSYLRAGRLADILSLLQTLALHPYQTHRNEDQLERELCGKPRSCKSWKTLAQLHPEFFRVSSDRPSPIFPQGDPDFVDDYPEFPISLNARHQGLRNLVVESEAELKIGPIAPELLKALMELALDMHDQAEKRKTKWFPFVGTVITALFAIAGVVITGVYFRAADNPGHPLSINCVFPTPTRR